MASTAELVLRYLDEHGPLTSSNGWGITERLTSGIGGHVGASAVRATLTRLGHEGRIVRHQRGKRMYALGLAGQTLPDPPAIRTAAPAPLPPAELERQLEAAHRRGRADAVVDLFRAGFLRSALPADVCRTLAIDPRDVRNAATDRPRRRADAPHLRSIS